MSRFHKRITKTIRDPFVLDLTRCDRRVPDSLITFSRPDGVTCATRRRMNGGVGPSRTNLLLWSNDVSNAAWLKVNGGTGSVPVVTANFGTAPDGTQTASRVQLALNGGTSTADISRFTQPVTVTSGAPYANSIWLKTNDGSTKTIQFRDDSANVGTGALVTLTGAWKRVPATGTAGTTTANACGVWLRGAQGTSDSADLLVWGGQFEPGLGVTPNIPTTTAAAVSTAWPRTNKINSNLPRLGLNLATVTSADLTGINGYTPITGNTVTPGRTYQVSYDYVLANSGGQSQFSLGGVLGPVEQPNTSGTRVLTITASTAANPQFYCNFQFGSIRNLRIHEQDLSGAVISNTPANGLGVLTIVDDGAAIDASGLRALVPAGLVYKADNSLGNGILGIILPGNVGNLTPHTFACYTRGTQPTGSTFTGTDVAWNATPNAGATYARTIGTNRTPATTGTQLKLNVSAGDVVYFVLAQLEEGTTASAVIPNATGAALTVQTPPAGDLEVLAAGEARIDYTVDGLTRGLRMEPGFTNGVTNSRSAFSVLSYNPNSLVAGNGFAAPDGSATATRINNTGGTSAPFNLGAFATVAFANTDPVLQQFWIKPAALPASFSVYAGDSTSVGGQTFTFTVASNRVTAVSNGGAVEDMGDGWQRLSLPYTASQAIGANFTFNVPAAFDALFWQAQIGKPASTGHTFFSDVITGAGATAARGTDTCDVLSLSAAKWNAAGWSCALEWEQGVIPTGNWFPTPLYWDAGSGSGGANALQLFIGPSSGLIFINGVTAGSTVLNGFNTNRTVAVGINRLAVAMKPNGLTLSLNGGTPLLISASLAMSAFTRMSIGGQFGNTGQSLLGWLRKFRAWDRAITGGELQAAAST